MATPASTTPTSVHTMILSNCLSSYTLIPSSSHCEPMSAERQRTVALARRRKERVSHGGNERDRADLAGSAQAFGVAVDDVNLYRRSLEHVRDLIPVEIPFDRAPVLESDVRFEGHAQPPDCPALDGVLADLRVERDAAVDHASDAVNLH